MIGIVVQCSKRKGFVKWVFGVKFKFNEFVIQIVIWNLMNCKKKIDKIYQCIIMEILSLVILKG